MLNAKLMVVGGEVKTTEIKLRLPCVIGRGKGSTVTLPHPLVSRQHCELFESNGRLWVRDLGSLNGTYVNNEKVSETELPPNELLTVGTVTFRAVYEPASGDATVVGQPVPFAASPLPAAHESQPTVRVEAPVPADSLESLDVFESADGDALVGLDDLDDDGAMPSTPLYSSDPTPQPAAHLPTPAVPQPLYPNAPAIPTMGVTPNPVHLPPQEEQLEATEEPLPVEPDTEDDDLNDFLKSLEKK